MSSDTSPSVSSTAGWDAVLTAHTIRCPSPRLRQTPCRRCQDTPLPPKAPPLPLSPWSPLSPATQASTASAPGNTDDCIRSMEATPTDRLTTSAQATPLESREDAGIWSPSLRRLRWLTLEHRRHPAALWVTARPQRFTSTEQRGVPPYRATSHHLPLLLVSKAPRIFSLNYPTNAIV